MPRTKVCNLTKFQRDCLVERIDEVLDDTDDWGSANDDEFQRAIQSWVDMIRALGDTKRAKYWIKEYKHICKLK